MASKYLVISKWQTVESIGLKQRKVSIIWIQEEGKKTPCTNPLELSHRLSWVLSQNLRQKSGGKDLGLGKGAWAGCFTDPTQYCGEESEGPSSLHTLDNLDTMQFYKTHQIEQEVSSELWVQYALKPSHRAASRRRLIGAVGWGWTLGEHQAVWGVKAWRSHYKCWVSHRKAVLGLEMQLSSRTVAWERPWV